jgi:hypothetical protein
MGVFLAHEHGGCQCWGSIVEANELQRGCNDENSKLRNRTRGERHRNLGQFSTAPS